MEKELGKLVEKTVGQFRKGILELCILSIIAKTESYSSDIIRKLEVSKLIVVEGTVYPLLARLRNEGLVEYHWKESELGPPRKYYQLTERGRNFLDELTGSWQELSSSVAHIIKNSSNHE